jgi:tRNA(Ile)-lysidine synthase
MQNAELVIKMNDGVNTELSEAGLRIWRYAQFAEICREKKIDFLLTGHHLNDRVESTFLHLLRGASLQGFLSMNYCDNHHLL